jgi:hypothetical protein
MSIPQNPWPESLRARFCERGYPVDQPAEEFPVARGTPRMWGYVHPQTGEAVVFVDGRQDARLWRADRVRESRALGVRHRPGMAVEAAAAQSGDTEAGTEARYLELLRRERTLTAELRLVKAEREQIERELARSMIAARMRETSIGPVQITPRARLAVRVTGERLRVEDLRDSGLQRWVRETVDYAALRRDVAQAIQADRDSGTTLETARQRFFDTHPRLAGKLAIEEEVELSVSGERRLYERERLAWTQEEDAALVAEYRGGARLDALVTCHQRPPSAIAGRLATLLWGAEGVEAQGTPDAAPPRP